jgi:hypothetical protein
VLRDQVPADLIDQRALRRALVVVEREEVRPAQLMES